MVKRYLNIERFSWTQRVADIDETIKNKSVSKQTEKNHTCILFSTTLHAQSPSHEYIYI